MPSVSQTRTVVRRFLSRLGTVDVGKDEIFSMRNGSTRVFVAVEDFGDGDTWIRIFCPVLTGVSPSPELFEYVALNAGNYRYGTVSAEKESDGAIRLLLTHGILGTYLDPEELRIAVALLADSADTIDDQLKQMFGGVRFHEDGDPNG